MGVEPMKLIPIRQIRNTVLLTAGLLGCASCGHIDFTQKAKERVIPYMSGAELLEAEKYAELQPDYNSGPTTASVNYWDSLILERTVNDAYMSGRQMVKDSIAGNPYVRSYDKIKFDTTFPYGATYKLDEQFANYVSADEFVKCRNAEPKHNNFYNGDIGQYNVVHYWNVLYQQFKGHEAFEQGAADERAANKD